MTEKTITEHYVKWLGEAHSITHDRNGIIPYIFVKDKWTKISDKDADWYKHTSKRNATWDYKKEKGKPTEIIYLVRFMGLPGKHTVKYILNDKDDYQRDIPNTKREYVFKQGIWIPILVKDAPRLKTKADCNTWWEFTKVKVVVGETPKLLLDQQLKKEKKKGKEKSPSPTVKIEV